MPELKRDSISEEDYSPQDEGWDARMESISDRENPYAINNWKHYDWLKGWTNADETAEGAP